MPCRRSRQIARAYARVTSRLVDIWMDKTSSAAGHVYIGIILTEAFFSPNPWVSPQFIYSQMGIYSVDTIRRRLEEMVDYGAVEVMEIDTKKVYRAVPTAANASIEAYNGVMKA